MAAAVASRGVALLAANLVPLLVAGLVVLALFLFGWITFATSLLTAIGVGLMVLAGATWLTTGQASAAFVVLVLGVVLVMFGDSITTMSLADTLSLAGGTSP